MKHYKEFRFVLKVIDTIAGVVAVAVTSWAVIQVVSYYIPVMD